MLSKEPNAWIALNLLNICYIIEIGKNLFIIFYNTYIMLNIVLDLDETIINTLIVDKKELPGLLNQELCIGSFTFDNNDIFHYVVFVRPNLYDFLNYLDDNFNIYIYTNACEEYAINAINLISKNITYFSIKKIQARITNNVTLKTLKTLDNFGLTKSNTLIIDDRSDVWDFEYRDIILQIDPYYAPHYVINYKSPIGITYNKFNWNSNYDEALLEFMKMIKCVNTQFNKFTIDTILHKLNKQKI